MLAQICYLIFQRKAFILRNYEVAGFTVLYNLSIGPIGALSKNGTRNLCYHLSLSETLVVREAYIKVLKRCRECGEYASIK